MTTRELLSATDLPRAETERLLMLVTGAARATVQGGVELSEEQHARFAQLVARRVAGEPLQYLEGAMPFGPVEVVVDGRALIPRPETEWLWEQAVHALGAAGPGTVIVDLCTGSGALALALKHRFPEAQVYATDLSAAALSLAGENAARLGLEVTFLHGDLFEALPRRLHERIDLLVTNPPYVAEEEFATLPEEIRRHEPREALVAGPAGTEVLRRIAVEVYWWLGTGGWLFAEIGETQGAEAAAMFGAWLDTDLRRDLAGRPRLLVGRKGARCCL